MAAFWAFGQNIIIPLILVTGRQSTMSKCVFEASSQMWCNWFCRKKTNVSHSSRCEIHIFLFMFRDSYNKHLYILIGWCSGKAISGSEQISEWFCRHYHDSHLYARRTKTVYGKNVLWERLKLAQRRADCTWNSVLATLMYALSSVALSLVQKSNDESRLNCCLHFFFLSICNERKLRCCYSQLSSHGDSWYFDVRNQRPFE